MSLPLRIVLATLGAGISTCMPCYFIITGIIRYNFLPILTSSKCRILVIRLRSSHGAPALGSSLSRLIAGI